MFNNNESERTERKRFSRTTGGINSQGKFYRSELVVYIEGKNKQPAGVVYDEHYYKSIFNCLMKGANIKIKVLGSCLDVLDMYYKVLDGGIKNTLSIIDRDYDGIVFTKIKDKRLMYTYGYSWENDFWTKELCLKVISLLVPNPVEAFLEFTKKISLAEKRLSAAHRANISFIYNGGNLFLLGKKGGDNGISINDSGKTLITRKEMSKFIVLIKNSPYRKDIIRYMRHIKSVPCRLIQGHYWEYVITNLISALSKKYSISRTSAQYSIIKNIAFTQFSSDAAACLSKEAIDHYQKSLNEFLH